MYFRNTLLAGVSGKNMENCLFVHDWHDSAYGKADGRFRSLSRGDVSMLFLVFGETFLKGRDYPLQVVGRDDDPHREYLDFLVIGQKVQNELLLGLEDLYEIGVDSLLLFVVKSNFYFFHGRCE